MRVLWPWAMLLILVAGVALGLSQAWSAESEIVAQVNAEPVTRSELQRLLVDPAMRRVLQEEVGGQNPEGQDLERLTLQKLITRALLLQEAGRRSFTVTERELKRAVTKFRGRFKNARRFAAWKKARGLDDKALREDLRAQILGKRVRAAVEEEARLTEEQVQEYYEAYKEHWKTAEEVRLRVIAVKDKAAAAEIMAALQKGEAFDRLARERSVGVGAAQVGDMAWVSSARLPSPLREAVESLKAGETHGPLQTGAEFLIVRLEERRPESTKGLADVRLEIERRLLPARQQEVFQTWLTEQEKKSKIEVFL